MRVLSIPGFPESLESWAQHKSLALSSVGTRALPRGMIDFWIKVRAKMQVVGGKTFDEGLQKFVSCSWIYGGLQGD